MGNEDWKGREGKGELQMDGVVSPSITLPRGFGHWAVSTSHFQEDLERDKPTLSLMKITPNPRLRNGLTPSSQGSSPTQIIPWFINPCSLVRGHSHPRGMGTRHCPDLDKKSYFRGTLHVSTANGKENVDFARSLSPPLCKSVFSSNKPQIPFFFFHFSQKNLRQQAKPFLGCRNPGDEKSSSNDFTPIKPLLEFYFK